MKIAVIFATFLATCLWSLHASAATCIDMQEHEKGLSQSQREEARSVLLRILQDEELEVIDAPCENPLVVQHIKLGSRMTVVMTRGGVRRRARANTFEELPNLYSQMVKAVMEGRPIGERLEDSSPTVKSTAMVPNRGTSDKMWYVRLGPATTMGDEFNVGSSLGFGYRFETEQFGIDTSVGMQLNELDSTEDAGMSFTMVKVMGLYFLDSTSKSSFFAGLGGSWAHSSTEAEGVSYEGSGIHADAVLGYEFNRASTGRLFIQAEASLPTYQAASDLGSDADTRYTPTFGLSLGAAWGGGGLLDID